jgi:hypothetical protein
MTANDDVARFRESALVRAVVRNRHDGEPPSGRPTPDPSREFHGATHTITAGIRGDDPAYYPPHGLPPQYQRPMSVMDLIVAGAPRALPVTQEIPHGPEQSRSAEFDAARQEAADLGHYHYAIGFRDRRFYGRRWRKTDNESELQGPQQPYDIKGLQRDVNTLDRLQTF